MAKTRNADPKDNTGAGNPPKNLKAIAKRKKEITGKVLIQALNRMPPKIHADGLGGHSLAAIRSYLWNERNLNMNFYGGHQALLKEVIGREFRRGRIDMANHNGDLNFRKRFTVAADVDENEMESDDTASSDEESEE